MRRERVMGGAWVFNLLRTFWNITVGAISVVVVIFNFWLLAAGKSRGLAVFNFAIVFVPFIAGIIGAVLAYRNAGGSVDATGGVTFLNGELAFSGLIMIGIGLVASVLCLIIAVVAFFVVSKRSYKLRG